MNYLIAYGPILCFLIAVGCLTFLAHLVYGRVGEPKKLTHKRIFQLTGWYLIAFTVLAFVYTLFSWDDKYSPEAIRKNAEVERKLAESNAPKDWDEPVANNGTNDLNQAIINVSRTLVSLGNIVADHEKKLIEHDGRLHRLERGFSNTVVQMKAAQQTDTIDKGPVIVTHVAPATPSINDSKLVIDGVLSRFAIQEAADARAFAAIAEMDARTAKKFAELEKRDEEQSAAWRRIETRLDALETRPQVQTNVLAAVAARIQKVQWNAGQTNICRLKQESAFYKKLLSRKSGYITIEVVAVCAPGVAQHDAAKELGIVMSRWFDDEGRSYLDNSKAQEEFFASITEVANKQFKKSGWPRGKISITEAQYTLAPVINSP